MGNSENINQLYTLYLLPSTFDPILYALCPAAYALNLLPSTSLPPTFQHPVQLNKPNKLDILINYQSQPATRNAQPF
jgi:hypothetical protein